MKRVILIASVLFFVCFGTIWAGGAQEADKTAEDVTLNVLVGHWTVGSDDSPFEAAKKEIESRYPNVTVVFDVQQGGGNVKSKFLSSAAAGQAPDVAMVDSVALGEMVDAGLLTDLGPYVSSWNGWEDILPNFREAGSWEGNPYGVFMNTDLRIFVWNKQIFKSAGLDPDQPPKTWDELFKFASAANNPPRVYGMMVPGGSSEHLPHRWYSFLRGAGGSLLDEKGCAAFNSQAGIAAAEVYKRLIEEGLTPIDVLSASADDNDRGLASGSYAMGVVGSWFYNYAKEAGIDTPEKFNETFGVSFVPSPDGSISPSGAGGWTVALPDGSRNKDLAWEFISIAMNKENHRTWALSRAYVPVRESLASDDAFAQAIPFYAALEDLLPLAKTRPAIPEYPQLSSQLQTALQSIMAGEMEVKEALDEAATEFNTQVDCN